MIVGWMTLLLGRVAINETSAADILVRPLILPDTPGRGDVIVVPGAGVTEACTPNVPATRRILLAADMYRNGRAPRLLIAGGRPKGAACTIADVMASLAVRAGVPRDRLLLETASRSTWENGTAAVPILRRMGAKRIVLVTDRLHMRRAEAVFVHLGYDVERAAVPVHDTHPDNISMLYWGGREYLALLYYHLRFL
jgi:uncharacterized SAM-binding protein YcdF (DUF218 family)